MTEGIVNQTHKLLLKSGKTVSVAESCTGGILSSLLTCSSGSSLYFLAGIVAYHNTIKVRLLKVNPALIAEKGAVSKEVATKMAQGARKIAKSDFGIGITGIAGPSGATSTKPLGTVFIAVANNSKNICKEFRFKGNRNAIRKKAALQSLLLLRSFLLGQDESFYCY